MSINILELVKDQISGQLASQASTFLGESESGVSKALGGIMPALLGGTISKASTDTGAQGLMDMLGKLDLSTLGNISGIFGDGAGSVNGLLTSGGGIVESLLGGKSSSIVDFIANMAGLKSSSSSSLLKMAAPFLMSIIGKQISGKGVGFLKELIMGQKSHVANAMPPGLGNLLGFGDIFGKAVESVKTSVPISTPEPAPAVKIPVADPALPSTPAGTGGLLKWILPALFAIAAIWYFTRNGCNKQVDETINSTQMEAEKAMDTAADAAGSMMDAAKSLFSNVDAAAKEAFDKLTIEEGSAADQIRKYIEGGFAGDPTFQIKNVNFATGSSALSKEAQAEVDNLAALLKVYPAVKIEINGHTDNTGDATANQTLSEGRAASVMGRLIADGIDAARLKAKGFGQTAPIADNASEEGRAQNRRIELKVVE